MTPLTAPPVVDVDGVAQGCYSELADAFARCLIRQGGGGAAFAVYVDGEPVVDLVGGTITTDSLVQVFSVSKAVVALAAAHAHARGLLDLDRPLGGYWAAFSRPTTVELTARMVLAHTCGIPAVSAPLTLSELVGDGLDSAVERQDPYWAPGTGLGYGAFTFGALMDGIFVRTVGESIGTYVERELTDPLAVEFFFGVPDELVDRLAPLQISERVLTPAEAAAIADGTAIRDGSFAPVVEDPAAFFSNPAVLKAAWPAMSGVSSARSLARLFAASVGSVDGRRLLDDAAVRAMAAQQSSGADVMLAHGARFGSGVELPHPQFPLLGPQSFGHQGAGGSAVAVDPARRVAVAYLTNAFPAALGASDAVSTLFCAVRFCLDAR